jgi:hypothetical protein
MGVSVKDIEENLEKLPKHLLSRVNDYIQFLLNDNLTIDDIPSWQIYEVNQRQQEMMENTESIVSEEQMIYFLKSSKK